MRPWRDIPSVQEFRASLQTADPLDVAWGGLASFRQAIEFYHNVPKRDINTLQQRQGLLLGISDRAGEYLISIGVDLNAPGEAGIRRTNKNNITQVTDVSFRRNLLTYHRRARRKARYLEQLRAYCQNTGPDELIALVQGTVEREPFRWTARHDSRRNGRATRLPPPNKFSGRCAPPGIQRLSGKS